MKKCSSLTSKIDHLEHVIRPGRPKLGNRTIHTIQDLNIPATQPEIPSYIRLRKGFHRYVSEFSWYRVSIDSKTTQEAGKGLPN